MWGDKKRFGWCSFILKKNTKKILYDFGLSVFVPHISLKLLIGDDNGIWYGTARQANVNRILHVERGGKRLKEIYLSCVFIYSVNNLKRLKQAKIMYLN